jgi:hypothetical protein
MIEKKYYVHPKRPFGDGTAYIERTGNAMVCVSRDGVRSTIRNWDRDHQGFADRREWLECTEVEAKSQLRVSATSAENIGEA